MKLPNTGPSQDEGQLATTDRPGGAAASASLLSVLRQPSSSFALYAASSAFSQTRGGDGIIRWREEAHTGRRRRASP